MYRLQETGEGLFETVCTQNIKIHVRQENRGTLP